MPFNEISLIERETQLKEQHEKCVLHCENIKKELDSMNSSKI
jgi:hypothetical protein